MADVRKVKKKRVSKKNKKAWRKFSDTKDVDAFLDEKRQEERIGTCEHLPNEKLFEIDDIKPDKDDIREKILTRKREKFLRPYRCLEVLQPSSAVPDPITKRNKGKSAEERKSAFVKRMEEKKRLAGHGVWKYLTAVQNRNLSVAQRKARLKKHEFHKDLWAETSEGAPKKEVDYQWIGKDSQVHVSANTGNRLKRRPVTMSLKTSVLTPIEAPHPGTSYNPSYREHHELLTKIVEDENKIIKEEKHLDRVVTDMIPKVTVEEVQENWMKEMSQGLPEFEKKKEEEISVVEEDGEKGVVGNPIVTRDKKKTLQKKRKIKEAKAELIQRREAKMEKKKHSDIERLSLVKKDIGKRDQKLEKLREIRERVKKAKISQAKVLSNHKFEPLEMEFSMKSDLTGNLRSIKPEGSILKDRFKRMQERNMIETRVKQTKKLKYKRKVIEKASYKMGWEPKGYD